MNTEDFRELPILRTRLEALAEREPPISAVDVAAARQAGDRIRRRRLSGRLSAVGMVAALGMLSFSVLPSVLQKSGGTPAVTPAPAPLDEQKVSYPLAPGTDPVGISGSF